MDQVAALLVAQEDGQAALPVDRADGQAALPVDRADGQAALPVDRADGRVAQEDAPREGAGHAVAAAAGDGTDRVAECAPSRLRA